MRLEIIWFGQSLFIVDRDIANSIDRARDGKKVGKFIRRRAGRYAVFTETRLSFKDSRGEAIAYLEAIGKILISSGAKL